MEVLDTSIANVALRYISGSLSAASNDGEWVITSYLAANAIVLPLSGWLSTYLGRRRYFLLSLARFTISSLLCGMATNLESLIFFRILQGFSGGGLQPGTQGVLLDSFPKEKRGAAMTVFAVATLVAPILGPTLGGWITDNYSWRWVFFINVPTGLAALAMCGAVLEDPPYLKAQRAEFLGKPIRFDYIGLGLITLGIASLSSSKNGPRYQGLRWMDARPFRRMTFGYKVITGGSHAPEESYPRPSVGPSPRRRPSASPPPVQGLQAEDSRRRPLVAAAGRRRPHHLAVRRLRAAPRRPL